MMHMSCRTASAGWDCSKGTGIVKNYFVASYAGFVGGQNIDVKSKSTLRSNLLSLFFFKKILNQM